MYSRICSLVANSGSELCRTPLLVPSISSRLNVKLSYLINIASEIIDGPLLVSAYDYKALRAENLSFPSLVFLDSGGYECIKEYDIEEIELYKINPRRWKVDDYKEVIRDWKNDVPTVLISYDHPDEICSLSEQIVNANDLFNNSTNFLRELLLKADTKNSVFIEPNEIYEIIDEIRHFDIIGFTEKELGNSIISRMVNIASIRRAMDDADISIPIHIFGSLDSVTTPLYFFAGADIFDGLSWARFIYHNDETLYWGSCGPKIFDPSTKNSDIWVKCLFYNINYLKKLEKNMKDFVETGSSDYALFGNNATFFVKTVDEMNNKIGGL